MQGYCNNYHFNICSHNFIEGPPGILRHGGTKQWWDEWWDDRNFFAYSSNTTVLVPLVYYVQVIKPVTIVAVDHTSHHDEKKKYFFIIMFFFVVQKTYCELRGITADRAEVSGFPDIGIPTLLQHLTECQATTRPSPKSRYRGKNTILIFLRKEEIKY